MSVDALLAWARRVLRGSSYEIAPREAATLLAAVLGWGEARLRARGEHPVAAPVEARFRALVARRADGEPAAYLLGHREFWGRDFAVDRRVLVPRPETEHLVETVLGLGRASAATVVDVGTGSGCIAVTLACERPAWQLIGVDRSLGALAVAASNARRHGVAGRVVLAAGDVLDCVEPLFVDVVVANPPYVAPGAAAADVDRHEPHLALYAGDEGRAVLTRLLDDVRTLRPGVPVLIEIGYDQAAWLRTAVAARPWLWLETLVRDYGGHERTAVLRRTSAV